MFQKIDRMKIKDKLVYGYGLVIGLMVILTIFALILHKLYISFQKNSTIFLSFYQK